MPRKPEILTQLLRTLEKSENPDVIEALLDIILSSKPPSKKNSILATLKRKLKSELERTTRSAGFFAYPMPLTRIHQPGAQEAIQRFPTTRNLQKAIKILGRSWNK